MFIFSKSLLFYPIDFVPHAGQRFAVSYEMKTNVTWIYSASHFASVEGGQRFIVGFIFVFRVKMENHSSQFVPKRTSIV